jgi:hypothetical protein
MFTLNTKFSEKMNGCFPFTLANHDNNLENFSSVIKFVKTLGKLEIINSMFVVHFVIQFFVYVVSRIFCINELCWNIFFTFFSLQPWLHVLNKIKGKAKIEMQRIFLWTCIISAYKTDFHSLFCFVFHASYTSNVAEWNVRIISFDSTTLKFCPTSALARTHKKWIPDEKNIEIREERDGHHIAQH